MTKLGDVILRGLASARPAAGTEGRIYYSTDAGTLERDNGSSWDSIDSGGSIARLVQVKVIDDATTLITGDGKAIFCVPALMNGLNLTDADAYVTTVSSSGAPTVQIRNVTQAADMLTTAITIDANETTSYTAATPPVIDTGNDDVATGDLIAIDVDAAGTGTKGLGVLLTFDV